MHDPAPSRRFGDLLTAAATPLVPTGLALDRLLGDCRVVTVSKYTVLSKAGEPAGDLYYVDMGLCRRRLLRRC